MAKVKPANKVQLGASGGPRPNDGSHYEPAFFVQNFSGMQVPDDGRARNAAFFAHAVARSPKNLRHHVQRINLHTVARDRTALWGALIDLLLILQGDGLALKLRMLAKAKVVLNEEQNSFLQANIKSGLQNTGDLPPAIASVLHHGRRGNKQIVRRRREDALSRRDPLIDALEHIEYGQVDEAQRTLEEALNDDPQRVALHHELLAIYRSKRDLDGLLKFYRSIAPDQNPAQEAWDATVVHLRGIR